MLLHCKHVLDACLQVFLDGQAALEDEERKEERAGKEFRRFNRRCHCGPHSHNLPSHSHVFHSLQTLQGICTWDSEQAAGSGEWKRPK